MMMGRRSVILQQKAVVDVIRDDKSRLELTRDCTSGSGDAADLIKLCSREISSGLTNSRPFGGNPVGASVLGTLHRKFPEFGKILRGIPGSV
jgi:hypothetical protein